MNDSTAKQRQHYTWADYQNWNDDQRWEIIGGDAYLMSPSPTSRHQLISGEMFLQMATFFKGKPCRAIHAALDVRLSDEDIVQPDLLVICNPGQIKRTHINGAPSLVVEIMSASSTRHDRLLKLNLYARFGVKEYWIVTPWPSLVEVLVLEGSRYVVQNVYDKDQTLISPSFPGLSIELREVFNFSLEPGEEPPAVKAPPAPRYQTAAAK